MPARGTNSGLSLEQALLLVENKAELKRVQVDIGQRIAAAEESEEKARVAWGDYETERADHLKAQDVLKNAKANFEARVMQENTRIEHESEVLRRREAEVESRELSVGLSEDDLMAKEADLLKREGDLKARWEDMEAIGEKLDEREADLSAQKAELKEREARLDERIRSLQAPV